MLWFPVMQVRLRFPSQARCFSGGRPLGPSRYGRQQNNTVAFTETLLFDLAHLVCHPHRDCNRSCSVSSDPGSGARLCEAQQHFRSKPWTLCSGPHSE